MKIGILTQPLHVNYGGLLQNFALQKVLKDRGHDVWTVDLPFSKGNFIKNLISKMYRSILYGNQSKTLKPSSSQSKIISQNTDQFIERYIQRTEHISSARYLGSLNKYQFDAYIVGSDQVWRPKYSPNIFSFYLDFLPDKNKCKRISFAASFGVDFWEYSKKQTNKCKELVNKFDAISVREISAIELCKLHLNVDASCVLDPTLLLQKEDYEALIIDYDKTLNSLDFTQKNEKGSLMMYVLDRDDDKVSMVKQVTERLNLIPNSIMPKAVFSDKTRDNIEKCIYPPVTDWIKGFKDADFVITDSFHGTAFAIIFNKPFIAIGNEGRGLSRFQSLLKMFGLESRLITKSSELNEELFKPIDYSKVNHKHAALKMKSITFLEKALYGK
tara:strand:+ start:789 stop:1946 length:1158 start_codon:yes stop_codon:yes gene_type:complete